MSSGGRQGNYADLSDADTLRGGFSLPSAGTERNERGVIYVRYYTRPIQPRVFAFLSHALVSGSFYSLCLSQSLPTPIRLLSTPTSPLRLCTLITPRPS